MAWILTGGRILDPLIRKGLEAWLSGRPIGGIGPLEEALYSDYLVGGLSIGKGSSAPTLKTFRNGIEMNAFAGTGPTEEGFFAIHVMHDIKAGTTPTFHVHWSHIVASPSGDVKWQVELTAAQGYESEAFPATSTLSSTHTAGTQYAHHITDDDDMAMPAGLASSIEPDMFILGRIFRDSSDAADTFANDAFLIGIDMHYQKGQIGTTERNRPFTSGSF
ncbi:MAG: hypothetical protein GY913_21795 [Proteobacteria bacterium]|nr:hypothetical protein [Actinomycetes bacterium]MCP4919544.1 hypothetical protein [Pseudomonadota bacterium]